MARRPASSVVGSHDFAAERIVFKSNVRVMKEVERALDLLKENALSGEKIREEQWPRRYVEKYGIRNLYRYGLGGGYRITYILLSEEKRTVVVILDLLSHPDYDRLFGY